MNKYDLIARVAKYATIVTSIYIFSRFSLNIHFDTK